MGPTPPDREAYFERWAGLHGGYDVRRNRLVRGWLTLTYESARPLARADVAPGALTAAGALTSGLVVVLAAAGGRWLLMAAALTVVSGLLDNLDGAVAVLGDRVTRIGHVLDSVVDRVSDGLYLLALWLAGAPAWVCVAAGVVTMLQEYTRARAAVAGMPEVGVVTVWERPTRVIVTAAFLLTAGLLTAYDDDAATLGAAISLGLAVAGLAQLLVVVRRRLTA